MKTQYQKSFSERMLEKSIHKRKKLIKYGLQQNKAFLAVYSRKPNSPIWYFRFCEEENVETIKKQIEYDFLIQLIEVIDFSKFSDQEKILALLES